MSLDDDDMLSEVLKFEVKTHAKMHRVEEEDKRGRCFLHAG